MPKYDNQENRRYKQNEKPQSRGSKVAERTRLDHVTALSSLIYASALTQRRDVCSSHTEKLGSRAFVSRQRRAIISTGIYQVVTPILELETAICHIIFDDKLSL